MKKLILTPFLAILFSSLILVLTGCEENGGFDDAADDAGDAVEEAGEEAEDATN